VGRVYKEMTAKFGRVRSHRSIEDLRVGWERQVFDGSVSRFPVGAFETRKESRIKL